MCAVSVITDYGMRTGVLGGPINQVKDFMDLIDKVKDYDRKYDEPDCESPDKAAWIEEIKARLSAMEKRLKINTSK